MIERKTVGRTTFLIVNLIVLSILAFSCLYPLWYTLCVSLSSKLAAEGVASTTFFSLGTLALWTFFLAELFL